MIKDKDMLRIDVGKVMSYDKLSHESGPIEQDETTNVEEFISSQRGLKESVESLKRLRTRLVIDRAHKRSSATAINQLKDIVYSIFKVDLCLLVVGKQDSPFRVYTEGHEPFDVTNESFVNEIKRASIKATSGKATDLSEYKSNFENLQPYFGECQTVFCYKFDVEKSQLSDNYLLYFFLFEELNPFQILFKEPTDTMLEVIDFLLHEVLATAEILMVPHLISVLMVSHRDHPIKFVSPTYITNGQRCSVERVYISLRESSKIPYIINVMLDRNLIELNMKIMEGWCQAKEWLVRERTVLEMASVIHKSKATYLLIFDKNYRLQFINNYLAEHVGSIFSSQCKDGINDHYTLSDFIVGPSIKETITNALDLMIDAKDVNYHSEHPNVTLRVGYDDHNEFNSLVVMLKYEKTLEFDPKWSVNFVLQPVRASDNSPSANLESKIHQTLSPKANDMLQHYKRARIKNTPKLDSDHFKKDHTGFNRSTRAIRTDRHYHLSEKGSAKSPPLKPKSGFLKNPKFAKKKILTSSRTINFDARITTHKDFDSDDDDVKNIKKSDVQWEKRLKKSIAMEYLPNEVVTPVFHKESSRKFTRGSTHESLGSPANTPVTNDVETQIYKMKLIDLKKIEVDQKHQEMNEKVKFFEDIIDIDTLVNHSITNDHQQKLSTSQVNQSYLYNWNFSCLDLHKLDKVCVVRDIFLEMHWFKMFDIKEQVFIRFIWEVAYYYTRNKNSFHNFNHAVNVSHCGFFLLKSYSKLSNLLTDIQQFSFVVSCLGHDLDHRGRTNQYEINTQSDLAITYHDVSPLEQHHAAVLFKILSTKGTNLMGAIKGEVWRQTKKDMLEAILATDMKMHFNMLTKFKQQLLSTPNFGDQQPSDQDRQLILNHFIHYADLSHSFKEFSVANRWSRLVNIEFRDQYIQEEELGLPPTGHFKDLDKEDIYLGSEMRFLKFIVLPMFELANTFMEDKLEVEKECINRNVMIYADKLELLENEAVTSPTL